MRVEFIKEWVDNPEVRKLIKTILNNVKERTENISNVEKIIDILIEEIEKYGIRVSEGNIEQLLKYDFFKELLNKYNYETLEKILFELDKRFSSGKYENLNYKVNLGLYYIPKLNVFIKPYIIYDPYINYLKVYLMNIHPDEIKIIIEKEMPFLCEKEEEINWEKIFEKLYKKYHR